MLGLSFSSLGLGSHIVYTAKTPSKKNGTVFFFYQGNGNLIQSINFLSPESAFYLYKSTIRPCIEYCCYVWAGAPNIQLDMFDKLQKRVCRSVGLSHTVPFGRLAHHRNVAG